MVYYSTEPGVRLLFGIGHCCEILCDKIGGIYSHRYVVEFNFILTTVE
jgi:hypothetical protein